MRSRAFRICSNRASSAVNPDWPASSDSETVLCSRAHASALGSSTASSHRYGSSVAGAAEAADIGLLEGVLQALAATPASSEVRVWRRLGIVWGSAPRGPGAGWHDARPGMLPAMPR